LKGIDEIVSSSAVGKRYWLFICY